MKFDNYLFNGHVFLNKRTSSVLLSMSCLIYLMLIFPDTTILFNEIYENASTAAEDSLLDFFTPSLVEVKHVLSFIGVPSHLTTPFLVSIYMMSLLLILLDYKPFLFSVLALFVNLIFVTSTFLHSFGVDTYISLALFCNLLIQLSRFNFSFNQQFYSYIIRFIQIQLCIIYFFAGHGKVLGTDWIDGNAMWLLANIFMGKSGEVLSGLILTFPFIAVVMSWGVVFIELFYPIIIHVKKTRVAALTAIIAMHIGIGLFMGLYSFAVVMIALNLVAYGHYYRPFAEKIRKKIKFAHIPFFAHISPLLTRLKQH